MFNSTVVLTRKEYNMYDIRHAIATCRKRNNGGRNRFYDLLRYLKQLWKCAVKFKITPDKLIWQRFLDAMHNALDVWKRRWSNVITARITFWFKEISSDLNCIYLFVEICIKSRLFTSSVCGRHVHKFHRRSLNVSRFFCISKYNVKLKWSR